VTRRINGPNGEFLGAIAAAIPLSYFEAFFEAINTQNGEAIGLFRQHGVLLARYPHLEPMIGENISAQSHWYDVVRAGGGTYLTPGYVDGVSRIISLQPVSAYPLVITVGVVEAQALALWRRQATVIAIGGGAAVIGFILLFWALGRQFHRLTDSEARFRDFATTSSDWFWETDAQHRISYMSEGVSTTGFGVKPSQLIGRTRMEIADDAGAELDKWREHVALLERHELFRNFEYRWSNPGGQGTATISGDPIFDGKGRFISYRGT
jgi:PAS domain S-box-containing protein